MHDRLRLTQAKMSDEAQLELLAPWYTQNTSESRTLDFFDAIPKYPFAVTTGIPKPERLEVPFTLRGKKYTAFVCAGADYRRTDRPGTACLSRK